MPKPHQLSATAVNYVLIARSQGGRKLSGCGSTRDLDGTRSMAQSILAMLPEAHSIDIYDMQVYQGRDKSDDDTVQLPALATVRREAPERQAEESE